MKLQLIKPKIMKDITGVIKISMPNTPLSDDDFEPTYVAYFFIVFSGLAALIVAIFVWTKWDIKKKDRRRDSADSEENIKDENLKKAEKKPNIFRKDSSKQTKRRSDKMRAPHFDHPWLYTTLKGHVSNVLNGDFSSNGKFFASVGSDRSLHLWHVKDFGEREHKLDRSNVELDNANLVTFAPDSKSVLLSLQVDNKLDVYKLSKKEGMSSYRFLPVEHISFPVAHEKDIISIGIASSGKFIMSASSDNQLVIYDIRGEILKTLKPKLNILYHACISPCGRFIAASGFTPDLLVFEVLFDRESNFQDVKKAFELKGHCSGIYSFAFDQSSTRCVTASRDGTWKIYDTDIRYAQGEEAKVIASGDFDVLKNAPYESVHVAISPSGNSFVISASRHLRFYSTAQPDKEFKLILDVHDKPISCLRMSSCGRMLASCGDRYIRIFHNVAEFYSTVVSLEKAIREARENARKRRLEEQLQEARQTLSLFFIP